MIGIGRLFGADRAKAVDVFIFGVRFKHFIFIEESQSHRALRVGVEVKNEFMES
jgi:hypothetical protein